MNKEKKEKIYSLLYVIDVSGQPYEDTRIGMGSFIIERQNIILKKFYMEFPDFKRSRNKGSALKNTHQLEKILLFLNDNRIHTTLTTIKSKDWQKYREEYRNRAFLKEKIMACLYFMTLAKKSRPGYKNQVIIDRDSFMNLDKLIDYITTLAKANKYNFSISVGRAKDNELIRLVDYIAASYKLNSKSLKKLKNHTEIGIRIPNIYLKKLFEKK